MPFFVAGTEIGKYKFLFPFFIFLYSRVSKEHVFDNFIRGEIYGHIKTNPGIHYNEILRSLDLNNGQLAYHLKTLEKHELIRAKNNGIYKCFYITGIRIPEEKDSSAIRINIINYITNNPGKYQEEIASDIGVSKQLLRYHLRILKKAGQIEMIKEGRKIRCHVKNYD